MAKYSTFKYGTAKKYYPNWITPITNWDGVTTDRKYYNYEDLNRVENDTEVIKNLLNYYGYSPLLLTINSGWTNSGVPYYDEINRIENNILALKNGFYEPLNWITPKTTWSTGLFGIGYIFANRVETDLQLLYTSVIGTIDYMLPCGTFTSGNDRIRQHFTRS